MNQHEARDTNSGGFDFDAYNPLEIYAEQAAEISEPERPKAKGSMTRIITIMLIVFSLPVAVFFLGVMDSDRSASAAGQLPTYSSEFLASAIGPDSPASPPSAELGHIVYRDGVLFVRGVASSQNRIDEKIAELGGIFGADNVVPEIAIDPNFPDEFDVSTSVFFSDTVLFQSGSAVVAPEFSDVLGASVAFLQLSPETTIEITGHTDSDGDEESNLVLSQARVDAARDVMISQGGDPDRLTATGKGETEPIGDNSTAEGRAQNRRVELTIGSNEDESN